MAQVCCGGPAPRGGAGTKLIWMSDPHVSAVGPVQGIDTVARLQAAVAHINAHHANAAFVVISGDLVEGGTVEDYAAVARVLRRSRVPVLPLVGNHDVRAPLRAVLPVPPTRLDGFVQYAVSLSEGVVLCLDTLDDGKEAGVLCPDRMGWIADVLKGLDQPVYVFMHHPPMTLGLPMLDPDNLANGAALLDLLTASGCVRHIFAGHVHRPVTGVVRGIPYATIQAVSYQAPAARPAWDWDSFAPAPEAPALAVVTLEADQVSVQYEAFCGAGDGVLQVEA